MIIIKCGILVLNFVYWFLKLFPVQNKIVMISRQSNDPSIEFQMIRKGIQKREKGVKVVFLCHTLDGGYKSTVKDKLGYMVHMLVQMYHIATSKVVVLDTYCMVISVLHHKKDLKVVQMWHSMGTMKKFGYTALDTAEGTRKELAYAMKMHQNYDYVFASSPAYKEHLASGFNCDINKILTMPLPRLDLLHSREYAEKTRFRIYNSYSVLKEKPVILYCPTFRKDERDFEKALEALMNAVSDEYTLVVKLHPLSQVKVHSQKVILAEEFTSFDMLFAADYVISDYSCIVYEAAVRGIPLYFYNFDMPLYSEGRGLAIDYYHELPGVISEEIGPILDSIEHKEYNREALREFADKYVEPVKHATKDIVDFIFQLLEPNNG